MTPRFRRYAVRSGNRSTPVLVYRGDASQRSAYELADLRCRPPPSTLFLLPEADKNDFSDALPAVADAMYAAPPRRKAAPSKPEKAVVRSEERRVGKEGRSRGGRET